MIFAYARSFNMHLEAHEDLNRSGELVCAGIPAHFWVCMAICLPEIAIHEILEKNLGRIKRAYWRIPAHLPANRRILEKCEFVSRRFVHVGPWHAQICST